MSEAEFNTKFHNAKVRVMRMDAIDGWANRELPAIAAALRAGIMIDNEECLFEALVMLCDLCPKIKPHN